MFRTTIFSLLILFLSILSVKTFAQSQYEDPELLVLNDMIHDMKVTSDRIYLATDLGLDIRDWNYKLIKHYDSSNGLLGDSIRHLQLVGNKLYCGAYNQGISILEGDQITNIPNKELKDFFYADSQGRIFATNKDIWKYNQISIYDNGQWSLQEDGPFDGHLECFLEDKDKNIWIASNNQISKYNTSSGWQIWDLKDSDLLYDSSKILQNANGDIYVGSSRGVLKFVDNDWSLVYKGNIKDMALDKNGILWLAAHDSGLIKLSGNTATSYSYDQGLNVYSNRFIRIDKSGNIWCGGDNKIYKFDGQHFTQHLPFNEAKYVYIYMVQTVDDDIWLYSSLQGVSHYNQKMWTIHRDKNELDLIKISDYLIDNDGNMWFAGVGGVAKYDGSKYKTYGETNSSYTPISSSSLLLDDDGSILIGSEQGLFRHKDGNFIKLSNSYNNTHINDIMRAPNGKILVGTDYDLWEYRDNEFHIYLIEGMREAHKFYVADNNKVWVNFNRDVWMPYHTDENTWTWEYGQSPVFTDQSGTEWAIQYSTLFYRKGGGEWINTNQYPVKEMIKTKEGMLFASIWNSIGLVSCNDGLTTPVMSDVTLYGLKELSNGDIYFSTYSGLFRMKRINNAPSFITETADQEMRRTEPFEYTFEATDEDDDELIFSIKEAPEWLSLQIGDDGTCTLNGTPSEAGDYEVSIKVSDGYLTDVRSFTIHVDFATGLKEQSIDATVSMSPNPTKDYINVEITDPTVTISQIKLVSITGQTVMTQNITDNKNIHTLYISHLQSGIYIVVLQSAEQDIITKKIIKQ
ncbi:T9SS type A sorting domain-containing protein [Puteibacter caeruleilacunae]|nr:T9SS type A sorting domain-containing protein [Puteibacter caeruleilacunae]